MLKYPTITDAALVPFRAIDVQLKEHPDYLDLEGCPYSPAVKLFLKRLLDRGGGGDAAIINAELSADDTIGEITSLYRELQRVAFRGGQVTGGDSKDQVDVLKKASDLLTKLVDLKAKAITTRDMGKFQVAVVELLERVITPAQRTEFIELMGKFIDLS